MTHKDQAQQLIRLADLGSAAKEFIDFEHKAKMARFDYEDARNEYMRKSVDQDERVSWFVENDPGFREATDQLYQVSLDAKRKAYNARRRLETKYRNLNAGGAK